jgi:hypothetical protein
MRRRLLRCTRSTITSFIVISQQTNLDHQGTNQLRIQLLPATTTQCRWQNNVAKPSADQATHGQADGLEHPSYFSVTPFVQRHTVPTVAALASNELNHPETCGAIIKGDTIQ